MVHDENGKPHVIGVVILKKALDAGDYALEGHEDICRIERKGSVRELQQNFLSRDRRRALASLHRLVRNCEHPILMLDFALMDFYRSSKVDAEPERALCELIRWCNDLGIRLVVAGACKATSSRRQLGDFVLKTLILHAFPLRTPVPSVTMEARPRE